MVHCQPKANLAKLQNTFYDGGADIVVEVISPESISRDTTDKYKEYEAGGVREYWLIDAVQDKATFYDLENGKFKKVPLQDGKFYSIILPGFWLQVDWLWTIMQLNSNRALTRIAGQRYVDFRKREFAEEGYQ